MSSITKKIGIQPQVREELGLRDKAMAGDMLWVVTPATVAPVPTDEAWTRTVYVELQTASGEVHEWLSKDVTISIANTSVAGTATIPSTTLSIVNGKAEVVVTGSEHDWLDEETDTLTVAAATILGYTVSAKTSVETFTAEA